MIKKVFISIVAFVLIQLIIVACCPEPTTYYERITNIEIANCSLNTKVEDSSSVSQKDFRIRLDLETEMFSQSFHPSFFINSAFATSCDEDYQGLGSDVVEFKLSCNKEILGVQAGEAINIEKLNIHRFDFENDSLNKRITIAEWIENLNNNMNFNPYAWFIEFNEPIGTGEYLKFYLTIAQEDSTEFNVETNFIKLQ